LHLRINHKRPSVRVIVNNGVLSREGILGKLINLPFLDLYRLSQDSGEIALLVRSNVVFEEHLSPLSLAIFTVISQENTHVGNESSTDDNITNNAFFINLLGS